MGALALMLPGCGGSGSSTGPTTTPPAAPVSTVVAQGAFQIGTVATAIDLGDPCDFVEFIEFQTSATGDIAAVVDWTFATSDLDIGLGAGSCTCLLIVADACGTEIAESESTTAKPERITAANQPAGSYTLVVVNWTLERESASYQVTLTR